MIVWQKLAGKDSKITGNWLKLIRFKNIQVQNRSFFVKKWHKIENLESKILKFRELSWTVTMEKVPEVIQEQAIENWKNKIFVGTTIILKRNHLNQCSKNTREGTDLSNCDVLTKIRKHELLQQKRFYKLQFLEWNSRKNDFLSFFNELFANSVKNFEKMRKIFLKQCILRFWGFRILKNSHQLTVCLSYVFLSKIFPIRFSSI